MVEGAIDDDDAAVAIFFRGGVDDWGAAQQLREACRARECMAVSVENRERPLPTTERENVREKKRILCEENFSKSDAA